MAKRILIPIGLFAFSIGVRALPWPRVFGQDRVYFFGADAYYHMRRILYSFTRFPEVLRFDPYLKFPEGAESDWPPLFDAVVAFAVWPFMRGQGVEQLERVVVWVPVLFGSATVLAVYGIALRHLDAPAAIVSALLLAVLPAGFWFSQVGFIDHHSAVAFVSTLLLGSAIELLRRFEHELISAAKEFCTALTIGVLQAILLMLWPGSLIHVAILGSALFVYLVTRKRREEAIRFGILLAASYGTASVTLVTFTDSDRLSQINPFVASAVQPLMLAAVAFGALGFAAMWHLSRWGGSQQRRILSVGLVAALLAGTIMIFSFTRLSQMFVSAWGVFLADTSFQSQISESQPLFSRHGKPSVAVAELRFSRLLYLTPLAFATASWSVRRSFCSASLLLFLWWFAVLCAATAIQRRFMNSFSPMFALLMGWWLVYLNASIAKRLNLTGWENLVLFAGMASLLTYLADPALPTYRKDVENQMSAWFGRPVSLGPREVPTRAVVQLAGWLRQETRPTSGYLDASERPEYSVLSAWSYGHLVRYEARRPVARDNFGSNFRVGIEYSRGGEETAHELLDRLKVRYVIVEPILLAESKPAGPYSMVVRLYQHDGSESFEHNKNLGRVRIPALGRHRLVSEFSASSHAPVRAKVFEYVRGARLAGTSSAGTRLHARLPIWTNAGRSIVYEATAEADGRGRYTFRLPYANRGSPPAVRVHPYYTLSCGTASARVSIHEWQVRTGEEIAGPDLCR